jgi:hypothetical protein
VDAGQAALDGRQHALVLLRVRVQGDERELLPWTRCHLGRDMLAPVPAYQAGAAEGVPVQQQTCSLARPSRSGWARFASDVRVVQSHRTDESEHHRRRCSPPKLKAGDQPKSCHL